MTFPFSKTLNYGKEHSEVYRPHMRAVNEILRNKASLYGLILIDADKFITGEEDLFWDPVHVNQKGDKIKAYMTGCLILRDLSIPVNVFDEWNEIYEWIKARSDGPMDDVINPQQAEAN